MRHFESGDRWSLLFFEEEGATVTVTQERYVEMRRNFLRPQLVIVIVIYLLSIYHIQVLIPQIWKQSYVIKIKFTTNTYPLDNSQSLPPFRSILCTIQ